MAHSPTEIARFQPGIPLSIFFPLFYLSSRGLFLFWSSMAAAAATGRPDDVDRNPFRFLAPFLYPLAAVPAPIWRSSFGLLAFPLRSPRRTAIILLLSSSSAAAAAMATTPTITTWAPASNSSPTSGACRRVDPTSPSQPCACVLVKKM